MYVEGTVTDQSRDNIITVSCDKRRQTTIQFICNDEWRPKIVNNKKATNRNSRLAVNVHSIRGRCSLTI